ncbi:hypothetical protein TCAL_13796, partial [Tigriopus californicus]
TFIALTLVAAASAAPAADKPEPAYEPYEPQYAPAPYKPAYKPAYKEPAYEEPPKYEYNYAVADHYSGSDFTQNEARDGYSTNGGYRVALPDGRTQIVTYTVQDGKSGFVADVRYEGEAQYPEEKPAYKAEYKPKYAPNECLSSVQSDPQKQKQLKMKTFIALTLVAAASAAPAADKPEPAYKPYEPQYAPAPYKPAYKPAYKEPAYEEPPKYEYNYAVADHYSGSDFTQNEARDGYSTNGGYRVALPDGRTQIVTYTVQDGKSGFVADVRYEGEAQYPEEKPAYKAEYKPKYAPVPAYQPAPAYEA